MSEKMHYLKDHCDWIRCMLMHEPRGNDVMSGAILTTPCMPEADIGVIYTEVGCYLPMCGHDTIGVATALVEAGMVEVKEPVTTINLETPAGLIAATVEVKDNVAKSVAFLNVPSFVMAKDIDVDVPGYGKVRLDVSYGGNPYAIVAAERFGLTIEPQNARKLIAIAQLVRAAVDAQHPIQHPDPELSYIDKCTHVEFYGPPTHKEAHVKNAVVILPGAIDRSPCGTGSSAKLALMHARGEIQAGETFVHESIIGSLFCCKVADTTEVAGIPAVIPEIKGSAYVTGMHTFMIDPDDPFPYGFQLE
jgi:proline racemase